MNFRTLLGLGAVGLALAGPATCARADTILSFGQNGSVRQVVATASAVGVTGAKTTIAASGVQVTITAIDGNPVLATPITAYFALHATSSGDATQIGSNVNQAFSGTFSITQNANGTGANYLSGSFTDSVFGAGGSLSLVVASDVPGESVNFTSSAITSLGAPEALALAFGAVSPGAATVTFNGHKTIRGFGATVSGNFSAVPEPGAIAAVLAGMPVALFGLSRLRRNKAA